MNVILTEDYDDDLWAGSVIHEVTLHNGMYSGMWTSRGGTYYVSVPESICKIDDGKPTELEIMLDIALKGKLE
jgi:phenolic acid decarboxylase